ncbi:MAG: tetratricopeptide repeat protein [Spirochaetales bacterium]|nr:tetratricopeptide repeat protein [Spirochaetales bacterium]
MTLTLRITQASLLSVGMIICFFLFFFNFLIAIPVLLVLFLVLLGLSVLIEKTDKSAGGEKKSILIHLSYTLFSMLVPVILFFLIEGGLRLFGYGSSYPLFMDSPGAEGYKQVNPDVVKRFLIDESAASRMQADTVFFSKDKPADTYRIFVQGGSTAAGFPYSRFGSITGQLNQRLRRTFPEKDIEVVTTAMAAVNSYTLLSFVDEIIAEKPDAVLVYAGHNEYLGILGVGSTYSFGNNRDVIFSLLRIKELRIFQLLWNLIAVFKGPSTLQNANVMASIAKEREIQYNSPLFRAGVTQFRSNLDDILKKYKRAGIPVFIGTLVSNERDQGPFVTRLLSTTDPKAFNDVYQKGLDAIVAKDPLNARVYLEKAVAMDPNAANAFYALAYTYELLGDFDKARKGYLIAKDLDQLRFRAPEIFNNVIRETAAANGATVVEVQDAFRSKSENGIIGRELIFEHLHPNIEGYFIMTNAYYNALMKAGLIGEWKDLVSYQQAYDEIPITDVDILFAEYKIMQLKADFPFVKEKKDPGVPQPTNPIEEIAYLLYYEKVTWLQGMERLLDIYKQYEDYPEALKVACNLVEAVPFDLRYLYLAGQLLTRADRPREAKYYLKKAVALAPDNPDIIFSLAEAYFLDKDVPNAVKYLKRVLELNPDNEQAKHNLENIEKQLQSGEGGPSP